jgi:hypothetical protein
MRVAQDDQLDKIMDDAHLLALISSESAKDSLNGLYEMFMNGKRTLALIMDTRTARDMKNAKLSWQRSDSPDTTLSSARNTPEYRPGELCELHEILSPPVGLLRDTSGGSSAPLDPIEE